MQKHFSIKALIAACQLAWSFAALAAGPADHAVDATAAGATASTQQSAPNPAVDASSAARSSAAAEQEKTAAPAGRFAVKKGSGGSQQVGAAPAVQLPKGPLGQAPEDINKLLAEAQRAGGQALDPIQREINLPGLKKDDPTLKPFVLHTRNGVNEIVKMSGRLLNRIATPFKKPVLIDTTGSPSKIVGSDIYYTPAGNQPIGLYIADSANTSQTISLTIMPDPDIPGQNLIVKLEDLRTVQNIALAAATAEEAEVVQPRSNDYTGFIRSLMAKAVRGNVPGFSPVPMEGGVARMGTLDIEPELAFTGSVVDIYRYRIKNIGEQPLDLVETAFFRKGVKAVSFFPRMSLQPGQQSYVFLLADKPASAAQEALQ